MKYIKFLFIASVALLFGSCGFLDTDNEDFVQPSEFYKNQEEAYMALTGVYSTIKKVYAEDYSIKVSATDDLCYYDRSPSSVQEMPVLNNVSTTSDATSYSLWTKLYEGVSNANSFLENINRTDMNSELKSTYIAEVRFLRAYYHFLLTQCYRDVPYRTEAYKDINNRNFPATSQLEILQNIVLEMETAEVDVLEIDSKKLAAGRVSKSAIRGILARVYLKMAGWPTNVGKPAYEKALYWAQQVNKDNKHDLNPDYTDVFINMASDKYEQKESIWEADFKGNNVDGHRGAGRIGNSIGIQNNDISTESLGFSYGFISVTLNLWDMYNDLNNDGAAEESFDEGKLGAMPSEKNHPDVRRDWNIAPFKFVKTSPIDGEYWKRPLQWKGEKVLDNNGVEGKEATKTQYVDRNAGKYRREYEVVLPRDKNQTPINYPLLRYSDVLLMIAEASNEVNNGPVAEATEAVKAVRQRSIVEGYDLVNYGALNYDEMKQLIKDERGRELCFESLRKYDLIRWNDYDKEMMKVVRLVDDSRWSNGKKYAGIYAAPVTTSKRQWWLPIPYKELSLNKSLTQNPDWQ